MKKAPAYIFTFILLLAVVIAAISLIFTQGQQTPETSPTPTAVATPEPTPELTPEPTSEPTPEPTPEPTQGPGMVDEALADVPKTGDHILLWGLIAMAGGAGLAGLIFVSKKQKKA